MKFDADRILTDRDGQPIEEPIVKAGKPTGESRTLTHGIVAVRAIDAQLPDDKELKPEDVRKRFILGARIMDGGLVDLKPDEAALIQKRACVFGIAIAGQVIAALDGEPAASAPAPERQSKVAKLVAAE